MCWIYFILLYSSLPPLNLNGLLVHFYLNLGWLVDAHGCHVVSISYMFRQLFTEITVHFIRIPPWHVSGKWLIILLWKQMPLAYVWFVPHYQPSGLVVLQGVSVFVRFSKVFALFFFLVVIFTFFITSFNSSNWEVKK